jgi:hypothetical protein
MREAAEDAAELEDAAAVMHYRMEHGPDDEIVDEEDEDEEDMDGDEGEDDGEEEEEDEDEDDMNGDEGIYLSSLISASCNLCVDQFLSWTVPTCICVQV